MMRQAVQFLLKLKQRIRQIRPDALLMGDSRKRGEGYPADLPGGTVLDIDNLSLTDVKNKIAQLLLQFMQYLRVLDWQKIHYYVDLKYEFEQVPFERIRRITGYLVGTVDRFNDGKRAEVEDRVKHGGKEVYL